MDGTQLLLVLVVITLTAILSAVGIQLFLVLRDVRVTLIKVNKVLSEVGIISEVLVKPASLVNGLMSGMKFLNKFSQKKGGKND